MRDIQEKTNSGFAYKAAQQSRITAEGRQALGFWDMLDNNRLWTKPIGQLLDVRERDRHYAGVFEFFSVNEIRRDPKMSVYDVRICRVQKSPAPCQLMI
jgi:hypothetical protein